MNTIANYPSKQGNRVRALTNPQAPVENLKLVSAPTPQARVVAENLLVKENFLPMHTTPNDLRELIRFLKQHPAGISLVEAQEEIKKRLLEPTKVNAYEQWGIITCEENSLRLSPLGWEFANKLALEAALFRAVLDSIPAYVGMLRHVENQQLNLLTEAVIVQYWQAEFPQLLQACEARAITAAVVSVLHLCQAAELGSLTIGKRGQPARLRVELTELTAYLSGTDARLMQSAKFAPPPLAPAAHRNNGVPTLRVSISLSSENSVSSHLLSLFNLLGLVGEIILRRTAETLLNSAENFAALRRCEAGIFVLTVADCVATNGEKFLLTPEVQMEISAAYLFYDRKIILLCDARIHLPETMQTLPRCNFDANGIRWEHGLALTQAILQFTN